METSVPALVCAAVVFVIAVLVIRKVLPASRLMRFARRLPTRPRTVFTTDDVRQQATTLLNRLAAELSRTEPAEVDPDLYERATQARIDAERALDSPHLTDVVGALVLARSGIDDLAIAAGRPVPRYQPCFINPLHEPAATQIDYTVGAGTVSVPVCRVCAAEIGSGVTDLDALPNDSRGGEPYYLGDDAWAVTGYGALVEDLPTALFRYTQAQREAAR